MRRKPRFRLFLFSTDTLFIVLSVFLFGDYKPFVYKNLAILFMDIIYTTVVLGTLPLLSALSLGGFGNKALVRMSDGVREFSDYALIILLLLVNTYFTSLFISHEITVFGQDVEIKYIHFISVAFSTLFVYRNYLFGDNFCTTFLQTTTQCRLTQAKSTPPKPAPQARVSYF